MNKLIDKKYMKSCIHCLCHKELDVKRKGYSHSILKYVRPLHSLCRSLIGPFVETTNRNKYQLVIVDGFSKFTLIKPVHIDHQNM